MPKRLLSFLLALLMFWSAFATQEQTLVISPDAGSAQVAAGLDSNRPHNGSVDDHHIDDQPAAQAHAEGSVDLYGLLPHDCQLSACVVSIATFSHRVEPRLPMPYLDGPRRPPKAPALMA